MENLLFGICGKPGAGKDTIGSFLQNEYGFMIKTIKEPIEKAVSVVFGMSEHELYDRDARELPLNNWPGWTTRKLLQGVAQSMRDLVGEHIWGKILCDRITSIVSCQTGRTRIVVPDVRTPGDVEQLRMCAAQNGMDFVLMMVTRPGHGSSTTGGFANHKLESYDLTSSCSVLFANVGTIEQLNESVVSFMDGIKVYNSERQADFDIFKQIIMAIIDDKKSMVVE